MNNKEIKNFLKKIMILPEGCWQWTGAHSKNGYGIVRLGGKYGKNRPAHRAMYEHFFGVVDRLLEMDHLCRNRLCVNPNHLEPVSKQENVRRGESGKWQRDKTHCPHNHEYNEENTVMHTKIHNGKKYKYRACRECIRVKREKNREYISEYSKKRYRDNREFFLEKSKMYRDKKRTVTIARKDE